MGTASGEISAGRLLLSGQGTIFPFLSNGTCGSIESSPEYWGSNASGKPSLPHHTPVSRIAPWFGNLR